MAKSKTPQYETLFDFEISPPTEAVLVDDVLELGLDFTQPDRPDPEFIDIIHRQHDGYICLTKKRTAAEKAALPPGFKGSPDFDQIVSIPAKSLPGLFTQVIEALETDAYSTINGMTRDTWRATTKNRHGYVDAEGKPLPYGYRKNDLVKWLTSCWVDIDCAEYGLTIGQTLGAVIDAVNAKSIPRPSLLLDSGRGCWCFWLLQGASPNDPLLRTESSYQLWEAAQGKILKAFQKIGGDAKSTDAARICRIPGSINSKNERRASYFPWLDLSGCIKTYALADLARAFGLDPNSVPPRPELAEPAPRKLTAPAAPRLDPPRTTSTYVPRGPQKISDILANHPVIKRAADPDSDKPKNPVFQQAGIEGHKVRWDNARKRLYHLIRLRGCEIAVGHRNNVILTMAIINRRRHCNQKQNIEDIETNLTQFLKHGDSLDIAMAIRSTVKSVYANKTQKHLPNQKVADWLDITKAEAKETGWPYSSKFGPPPDTKPTPDQIRQERQAKILEVVAANNGEVPSSRIMLQALINAGIKIGKSAWRTVANDYAELGLVSDSKAGRRRKVSGDEPQLFE